MELPSVNTLISVQVVIGFLSSQRLTSIDADLQRFLLILENLKFDLSDSPSVFSLV